ncbi:MAG TPA: 3-hydroxylacyl-ACP dehydratase [Polaromonas sp.]|uniref:3-hydroxylacyl-ACP dehydratase n=1 Tax=Polaromonas sp. TaxID=1869339 RepID=UPI002D623A18|nr:3-hydroxylacyl-ACP dehydratase [Polaromonas sp.]HYW56509.1 3-hydroxylacyl-ACP dehydratase [Polaromonas sp.]
MSATTPINRDGIARRIPHQGSMCLLDEVTAWDDAHISCQTTSHLAPDNPLRAYGQLGAACGIEYAAQAMAMHGALVAERLAPDGTASIPTRGGYLASVRSVIMHVERLDTVAGPLMVHAERVTGDTNTVLYSFTVQAGAQALLSGRAVVVLDASAFAISG